MKYVPLESVGFIEAQRYIEREEHSELDKALMLQRAVSGDSDWIWLQNTALGLVNGEDPNARIIAIRAFGDIARIHRLLNLERVLPALQKIEDPELQGYVEDTIDDLRVFLRQS